MGGAASRVSGIRNTWKQQNDAQVGAPLSLQAAGTCVLGALPAAWRLQSLITAPPSPGLSGDLLTLLLGKGRPRVVFGL